MNIIQKIGLLLFITALGIFTLMLGLDSYKITENNLDIKVPNNSHKKAILEEMKLNGLTLNAEFSSSFALTNAFKKSVFDAQSTLETKYNELKSSNQLPNDVSEWDYKIWTTKYILKDNLTPLIKYSSVGPVTENPLLFWFLTIGLAILGGLLYILPKFTALPGIKHNGNYHNPLTRGLTLKWRTLFLGGTIIGVLIYGAAYMAGWFWPIVTIIVMSIIGGGVFFLQKSIKNNPSKSASPSNGAAWLGIVAGTYLIGFYILLYWSPHHLTAWMTMSNPLSQFLSGGDASQWFVYGMLYTVIVLVMGIRMMSKYRHNQYQMIRTGSVMFFQTAFAFLIPQILSKLGQPSMDLKNMWPLNYEFFFDSNLNKLLEGGNLGLFMLVWGIVLVIIGVPVITYFFGKRWYCSWVCGCGGLAETMGDSFRQLSDKSLRAWKFERYIIHGVLVFAVIMTGMVLTHFFTGNSMVLGFNSYEVREWYGFLIGSSFAGVVGTGFYPLMGNRTWCRFGCPLAGYLGLVQRFKSKFRITTNGGQCISCGNCSTYCEMGIDVRSYAQKGQDIVRSSCVGCGVCSAVCPRGVLRLENSGADISDRAKELRAIHITEDQVTLL